ncbi:MAG: hypothetical protein ACOH2A_08295 [Sphingobacteriaceae bacterium]
MKAEHPIALPLFMQDELYLLAREVDAIQTYPEITVSEKPLTINEPTHFIHLGNNKRYFLVLVNTRMPDFLEEGHLRALINTLERKGLQQDDIAILNMAQYPNARKEQLISFFNPEKILFLGVDPQTAGWREMPLNTITTVENQQLLYSYGFEEMLGNKEKTIAFWNPMKGF